MCMIDDSDEDWWGFTPVQRRAAKEHRCDECSRTIQKGETYHRHGGASRSWGISTFDVCEHCEAVKSWLDRVCGGYLHGGVLVDLEEHWDESPEYCSLWLGRAILGMRRQWKRRDGSLLPVLPKFDAPLPHDRIAA